MGIPRLLRTAALKSSLIVGISLFACTQTSAADDDCGAPVDLTQAPGPFAKLPVLDQGRMSNCYILSLVQLIDSWRFSHGDTRTDQRSSPIATTMDWEVWRNEWQKRPDAEWKTQWFSKDSYSDQDLKKFVERLGQRGTCDARFIQESVPDLTDDPMTGAKRTYFDILHQQYERYQYDRRRLRGFQQQFEEIRKSGQVAPDDERWKTVERNLSALEEKTYRKRREIAESSLHCLKSYGYPDVQLPDLAAVEQLLEQNSPLQYVQGLITRSCQSQRIQFSIPGLTSRGTPDTKEETFRKWINERLDQKNPQPVAAIFATEAFLKGRGQSPYLTAQDSDHMALIVGRRKSPEAPGKCQYLIRNSWGSQACEERYFKKDWKCVEGTGDAWVDQDIVSKTVSGIYYLGD